MKTNKTSNQVASDQHASFERMPMSSFRKTSLVAGILYLITFVSIPTISIYSSIHDQNYLLNGGTDTATIIGGILEIIVALASIGSAIALFPVLKKQNEAFALGLVASRILEASTMFVGVAFILSVVTLKKAGAGTDSIAVSHALVALYDRIFLLGQSFMPAINDLLLGILLYQSRLVPRALSLIGILGAVPLIAGYFAVMFGFIGQHDALSGLASLLVALFEFSLGIYLVVKGFRTHTSTNIA
jgi:Domain of unknown function (DUF4386)